MKVYTPTKLWEGLIILGIILLVALVGLSQTSLVSAGSGNVDCSTTDELIGRIRISRDKTEATGKITNCSDEPVDVGFAGYEILEAYSHLDHYGHVTGTVGPGEMVTFVLPLEACDVKLILFEGEVEYVLPENIWQSYDNLERLIKWLRFNNHDCQDTPTATPSPEPRPSSTPTPTTPPRGTFTPAPTPTPRG